VRKRPKGTASDLDRFADDVSMSAQEPASVTARKPAVVLSKEKPAEELKLVSTRLPLELVQMLARITAHTELSIQDVVTEGVRQEVERVVRRYEEQVGHALPPVPAKVRL